MFFVLLPRMVLHLIVSILIDTVVYASINLSCFRSEFPAVIVGAIKEVFRRIITPNTTRLYYALVITTQD